MSLSPFTDPSHRPEPEELAAMLGPSAELWDRLVRDVAGAHAPIEEVWNQGGPASGWTVRLKRKDRVVLYLIPQSGTFLAGIVLGEKAVNASRESGLPSSVLELIDSARPYAEGRGIRLPVAKVEDVDSIATLVAAKMATYR